MPSLPLTSPIGRAMFALAVFTLSFWSLALAAFLAWSPGRSVAAAAVARFVAPRDAAAATLAADSMQDLPDTALCEDESGFSYSTDDDDDSFSWSLMDGADGVQMGSLRSMRFHARTRNDRPTFWFREGGQTWSVDDPDVVSEVRRVTEPLREIGREMGKVGSEMGRRGAEIGRIGGRMGALGARLAALEARLATRHVSQASRARARESIRAMRIEMKALQEQIGGEQSGRAQSRRELSRRMSELSARHQVVLRDVREKVREIARRVRREGKAERPHANA